MDNHQLQQKQLFTRAQQKEQTTTYLNKPQKEHTLRGVEQQRGMGQPQEIHTTTKKGMLNDVSLVAIIASTLASITSFVLSSQIGLTGSLIGVGVAAATSALASQVCSSVLTATGEKIKAQQAQQAQSHGINLNNNHYDKAPYRDMHYPTPLAPQHLRLAAARQAKRRLVLISVTSTLVALICVGIYAAVVMFATHGEGIGSKQVLNSNSLSAALASKKPENTEKTAANTSKKNTAANGKNKDVSADQNTPDTNALDKNSQKQTTDTKTQQNETNQKSDENHKGVEDKHKDTNKDKTRSNDDKSQGAPSNQQNDDQQKASKDAADN